jgi:transcription antitermination factor NusG
VIERLWHSDPADAARAGDGTPARKAGIVEGEVLAGARWYACQTRSRAEKRVERLLMDRGIEAYLPRVHRERRWADRTRIVEFPLFPGYVFGRFRLDQLHPVLATVGLTTVVRLAGRPAPIADDEIENLRRLAAGVAATSQRPQPQPFSEGDWVRVIGGPFGDLEGVVVQLRGKRHVLAGLRAIGQGIVVFIEAGRLQKIATPGAARPEPV